jgi:hypothetical protein
MDITDTLKQEIGWAPKGALNVAGEAGSYGAVQTLAARVEDEKTLSRRGPGGNQLQSGSEVWVAPDAAVAPGDRIWLPGADRTKARESREVLGVKPGVDLDGMTVYQVVSF